jgi:hypothetical protein
LHDLAVEDRISQRVAAVAVRGHCHVDPGRKKQCAGWLLHAQFFQSDEQSHGQAPSRAIAGDRDLTRFEAEVQEKPVSADRIFQGMRKRELRGTPVVESERSHRRRTSQLAHEVPVTLQRAPNISSAVQMEDGFAGARDRRGRPFSGNAVCLHLFYTDIRCQRKEVSQSVGRCPTLPDSEGRRLRAKHGFQSFKLIHRNTSFSTTGLEAA